MHGQTDTYTDAQFYYIDKKVLQLITSSWYTTELYFGWPQNNKKLFCKNLALKYSIGD